MLKNKTKKAINLPTATKTLGGKIFKAYTSCIIEQKPASWSKEDEKQARQIERIVHDDGCTQKLQKQIADWFESLKERYTWKPSDEQIEALESATENCAYSEYQDCLKELIEQLKKLKS